MLPFKTKKLMIFSSKLVFSLKKIYRNEIKTDISPFRMNLGNTTRSSATSPVS